MFCGERGSSSIDYKCIWATLATISITGKSNYRKSSSKFNSKQSKLHSQQHLWGCQWKLPLQISLTSMQEIVYGYCWTLSHDATAVYCIVWIFCEAKFPRKVFGKILHCQVPDGHLQKFFPKNFLGPIRENFAPWKFHAIRYSVSTDRKCHKLRTEQSSLESIYHLLCVHKCKNYCFSTQL